MNQQAFLGSGLRRNDGWGMSFIPVATSRERKGGSGWRSGPGLGLGL